MMDKECSKCRQIKDISLFYNDRSRKDGRYCYCKDCAHQNEKSVRSKPGYWKSEYFKKYRSTPQAKAKHSARAAVYFALKNGVITKEPCKVCSSEETQAHHEDYSKPLEVVWLCSKHHLEIHHKEVHIPNDDHATP